MPHLNIYMDEDAARASDWPSGYQKLFSSIKDDSFVAPDDDASSSGHLLTTAEQGKIWEDALGEY